MLHIHTSEGFTVSGCGPQLDSFPYFYNSLFFPKQCVGDHFIILSIMFFTDCLSFLFLPDGDVALVWSSFLWPKIVLWTSPTACLASYFTLCRWALVSLLLSSVNYSAELRISRQKHVCILAFMWTTPDPYTLVLHILCTGISSLLYLDKNYVHQS